jgi:hypothetical protein
MGGGTLFGALLGYLTLLLVQSSRSDPGFVVLGFLAFVAAVVLFVAVEERLFWPFVAHQTHDPGLEIRIERVEVRRFYHLLIAISDGRRLPLMIAGLPGRVRRAVGVAGSGAVADHVG